MKLLITSFIALGCSLSGSAILIHEPENVKGLILTISGMLIETLVLAYIFVFKYPLLIP